MAQEYRINKHGKQAKVQRESEHTMQRSAEESPKSLVKKQEVPAKVDQGWYCIFNRDVIYHCYSTY